MSATMMTVLWALKPSPTRPYSMHMILHPPETAKYMTRKSETGPVSADGDPAARLEWKDASQSALKKATKLYAQHQKKQSKASDLAVRESAEGVRRQQLLQEAKKIIIEEDKSLPKAILIRPDDQSSRVILGSGDQKGTRVRHSWASTAFPRSEGRDLHHTAR